MGAYSGGVAGWLGGFGGTKDARGNTGAKRGGGRAKGGGGGIRDDKGEGKGVWGSRSGDQLSGKNVEDNWRVRGMTGYYYQVIHEHNRRVTGGLTYMIWHYDKHLCGYSLGQGSYFHPP